MIVLLFVNVSILCLLKGHITTAVELDYESLSPNFQIEVDVVVSDGPQSSTVTLTVKVEDVNEKHELQSFPSFIEVDTRLPPPSSVVCLTLFIIYFNNCLICLIHL